MRYGRRYSYSKPKPHGITVKFPAPCACCGAEIKTGETAMYYPAGTIAGVSTGKIAHVGGLDGTSRICFNNLKTRAISQDVDRFDMQYEDNCKDSCGL